VIDDLALLLDRARAGEGNVHLVGETTVRDTYLPVRIVEHFPAPNTPTGFVEPVTDYAVAERLPRTPENEQLLRMSPHPGAKQVTEGRL
jgi:hypothetical protein